MNAKGEELARHIGEPGSENRAEIAKDIDLAEEALAAGNCQELFVLWERAVKQRGQALELVGTVYSHFKGDQPHPLYQPTADAVSSMERVALAAIDLAKSIARDKREL